MARLNNKAAFTRNRDLPLPDLVVCMINMISLTTCIELYKYFTNILKRKVVSKQAFSLARGYLNHKVFIKFNNILLEEYYKEDYKTYKDYLVFACDGTGLELPSVKEFIDEFGCPSNQNGKTGRPVGRSSILYDINNEIIIDGILDKHGSNEKRMFLQHLENLKEISNLSKKKIIVLFDRGYPSTEIMAKMKENNIDFIMRTRKSYSTESKVASRYANYDRVKRVRITRYMTENKSWLKSFAKENNSEIQLRFVSGRFKDKEIGVFVTSLPASIFNREEIVELYRRRWEIETHFRHEKKACAFENFACKTTVRLKQEYYCKIYTINFATLIAETAKEEVNKKMKSREIDSRYPFKINKNVAIGLVKDNIARILLSKNSEKYIDIIVEFLIKQKVPIIEGRIFKRNLRTRKRSHEIQYRKAS